MKNKTKNTKVPDPTNSGTAWKNNTKSASEMPLHYIGSDWNGERVCRRYDEDDYMGITIMSNMLAYAVDNPTVSIPLSEEIGNLDLRVEMNDGALFVTAYDHARTPLMHYGVATDDDSSEVVWRRLDGLRQSLRRETGDPSYPASFAKPDVLPWSGVVVNMCEAVLRPPLGDSVESFLEMLLSPGSVVEEFQDYMREIARLTTWAWVDRASASGRHASSSGGEVRS
jgi:hypothetical protein